jgi:hypothetical protein
MTMTSFSRAVALAMIATPLVLVTPATAQEAVRTACWQDIQRLCPTELGRRNREAIRGCLRSKIADASEGCRTAIRAQMAANREAQTKR